PANEIATVQDVLDGAREILAETFSEMAPIRNWARNFTMRTGTISATVKTMGKELDEKGGYQQYYDFEETVKKMSSTRT
ncbi:RNA-binding transcriptional accessory protein, partial [Lactobacillus paracasei]|nr:RNA-binding transcriptional accessory protein [Lacticaseibacillus paracasei]